MRILFISPYIPSLIRVRSFNFIKALKKQGHSIYLVCLVQEKQGLTELLEIEKYCEKVEKIYLSKYKSYWNCLKYLFLPIALQSAYCFSTKMSKRVENITKKEKFDLIHIEHIRAAHFLPEKCSIYAIYDSVDCITALYEQFYKTNHSFIMKFISYIEWLKLKRYEPKVLKKFDRILVTSFIDKKELEKFNAEKPVEIVVNGVDLEYFTPKNNNIELFSVVITGKMSYIANEVAVIYFIEKIWPKVIVEIPQAKLYVVGNEPGPKIKKYRSVDIIITGYVSDLRLYLSKANVVIAPIIAGGGIQNKILEAMSMGKPVVTTSKGAEGVEGLIPINSSTIHDFRQDGQARFTVHDSNICLADTPEEFASAVVNILKDAKLAENLGVKAREFVEKYYNWDEKGKNLVNIYAKYYQKNLLDKSQK